MMKFELLVVVAVAHLSLATPVQPNANAQTSFLVRSNPAEMTKIRLKRQTPDVDVVMNQPEGSNPQPQSDEPDADPNCDFGFGDELKLCEWKNLNISRERWMASRGMYFGWLGGPPIDQSQSSNDGGYALYETSKLVENQFTKTLALDSAMLMSPVLDNTDAVGTCVDFWYAMDGLSQDRLRILLRPPPPRLMGPNAPKNLTRKEMEYLFMNSDGRDDIVLWEHMDTTQGIWINGQVVYSFNEKHMIIFEGLPLGISDLTRAYVGYVALDDLKFIESSECKPFCNFEGGFCSWSQDNDDDFDWILSRGSTNPSTGPPMDRFSFNYGIKGGGYAYIDSGYPRRPQDKARIFSEVFSPPGANAPLCMRFWTHMFGNGVGALRVLIKPTSGDEEIIWELKGEQGNNWYQGQVTITAILDFQIVIEAEVGKNNLGDIAIDEIALKENACPTSPQSASKFLVDCTFEVDECGWKNVLLRQRMDELDWERTVASQVRAPNKDHTLKSSQGSFMTLPRTTVQRPGERGWLMSASIKPPKDPLCLSFWYYMDDPFIEANGPSLGALNLILMEQDLQGFQTLTPLWKLKNQQGPTWNYGQTSIKTDKTFMILFEGLWGNSKGSEYIALDDITFFMGECTNVPAKSMTSFLDCDFTRDTCAYMNLTSGNNERWITSSISRRPSTLADHTYGGPVGYLYFDVFNTNSEPPKVTLMSRVIDASQDRLPMCISLWFAPIGSDPATKLMINRETVDASSNDASGQSTGTPLEIWSVNANTVYKDRIEWMFGQIELATDSDFKISVVGEAKKGGFAIDDIQVYPGTCKRRPKETEIP